VLPTVARILALPELTAGLPEVLAGESGLGNEVRWVHVAEPADIARLLNGGEFLLTTGIGLPDGARQIVEWVESLAGARASALVIELGRKFQGALPAPLVAAADRLALPLIVLHEEVRFVKVTEAAHTLIINSQLTEQRRRVEIDQVFTELTLEGASTAQVVGQASRILRRPVVLENLQHKILAYETAGEPVESLLDDWVRRSRGASGGGRRLLVKGDESWLVTMVGARGEMWARLVAIADDTEPTDLAWAVLERAATALALNRLIERDREGLERQSHRSLLADILNRTYASQEEIESRSRNLGVPLADRSLVGCVVKLPDDPEDRDTLRQEARRRDHLDRAATACRDAKVPSLVGILSSGSIGILAGLSERRGLETALARLADAIHTALVGRTGKREVVIAVGSAVTAVNDVRRSFQEAEQVAEAVGEVDDLKVYYRLPDIRVRGLLQLLQNDGRVHAFVERELAPLIEHDHRHRGDLIRVLGAYLDTGRNVSVAAQRLGMSRPAFYSRLQLIQHVLGADLSVESCLSLHVALLGAGLIAHAMPSQELASRRHTRESELVGNGRER
jgi:PucR family transcriptional regulator, purine catabolism regulatory protein